MGTKVEGKSFMPGYFAMGKFSVDENSCYSRYENTVNGQIHNGFVLGPNNGYMGYDKEMLKRTMLEHEAIFRKQVYELHRLYRIQKDLMEEFQRKELHGYSIPADTSQSNSITSQMLHLQNANDRSPTVGPDQWKPYLNFLKENSIQSCPDGLHLNKDNLQGFTRKMFDLQLPADARIGNDGSEIFGKKNAAESSFKPIILVGKISGKNSRDDFKLSLGANEGPSCKEDSWISDSQTPRTINGHKVVDLNETVADSEGATDNASIDFLGVKTYNAKDQLNYPSTRSNVDFLGPPRFLVKDRHANKGTSSNFFDANEEIRRDISFVNSGNGKGTSCKNSFTPNSCNGEFGISSKLIHFKLNQLDQDSKAACPAQKPADSIGAPGRKCFAIPNNLMASSSVLQKDHSNTAPQSVLYWANSKNEVSHTSAAVKAFPCLNSSNLESSNSNVFHQQSGLFTQNWKNCEGLSNLNSYNHGLSLDSISATNLQHLSMIRPEVNYGCNESMDSRRPNMALSSVNGHSEMMSSSNGNTRQLLKKKENVFGLSVCKAQFQDKQFGLPKNETSDETAMRILGFSVGDNIQKSAFCSSKSSNDSNNRNREKDYIHDACFNKPLAERALEKSSMTLRIYIDLNDELPSMDDPSSSEFLPETQKAEGNVNFHQESVASSKPDGSLKKVNSDDSFAISAAKNLIAISKDIACLPSLASHCDTLQWFAEVAISSKENSGIPSVEDDDELDLFETMTLELEETKIEDYLNQPKAPECEKGEETGAASLLFTRTRRGRARRRRQRRDFQKDILPGLVSLARNEVTEDLQMIGGLMKASGQSWQSSLTRRASRNGLQAKGRKQSRSVAVAEEEEDIQISTSAVWPNCAELGTQGASIVGWGRTTRRCRRPRCPPSNLPTVPLT
ncbi:uncharacterized protein LOC109713339 isoform X1 [Ananas comosus]|uniref:Uncharacterized protein LOC109713339 isoform X1 n=2 Tax=Ananas comosus TaxID=4615 RepID=A0A6P5FBI7_ANACO|nr:uncharacterized protein LOC109713339 isoform X1 [Ananas comosus]XP_020092957.1 uncharacterized protein LOC109713339 isoform X1 [Ananas comosus]XP_020092958.1 uncharacterized protein LOC109713339 isoform X1 [Ananas comosus]